MADGNAAGMGHNNPPEELPYDKAALDGFAAAGVVFMARAGEWLDLETIEDEENAGLLADFISGVKGRRKIAEESRKRDKTIWDDKGKAVQAAYLPVISKLDKAVERVQPMMTAWIQRQDAIRRAAAEAAAAAAAAKRAEAEAAAAAAAARNDISGEVDAEAAQKEAEKAEKEAARMAKSRASVRSGTGAGRTMSLRTLPFAHVINARVAAMRYHDHPDMLALLARLATAELRSAGAPQSIPGIEIRHEQKAV